MAAKTIRMEQVDMILGLQKLGFSVKGIFRHMGLARNTVRKDMVQGPDDGQRRDGDDLPAFPPISS